MRRRLVYLVTTVFIGWVAVFAVVLPGARLAVIALGAAVVAGASWLARRLPVRPVSAGELGGAAAATLIVGIALAVLLPATRIVCDCPPPRGVIGGYTCRCPVDFHTVLRSVLALGSVAVSAVFAVAMRRQAAFHRRRVDRSPL